MSNAQAALTDAKMKMLKGRGICVLSCICCTRRALWMAMPCCVPVPEGIHFQGHRTGTDDKGGTDEELHKPSFREENATAVASVVRLWW